MFFHLNGGSVAKVGGGEEEVPSAGFEPGRIESEFYWRLDGYYNRRLDILHRIGIHFHLLILFSILKFSEKLVIELQHSQHSVLWDKKAIMVGSLVSITLYLVKLIFDMPQSLEHFIVDRCMCLFIIHSTCN